MDEQQLVHVVAADMVERYGDRAIEQIEDYIDEARRRGDELSVQAWRDISDVVAERVSDIAAPSRPERGRPVLPHAVNSDAQVLIVDDDPDVLDALGNILSRDGHVVHTARGSREALRAIDGGTQLDLLLTDLVMPRINGLHLASQARQRLPSLKVLFLTGYADRLLAETKGAPRYGKILEKPIMPDALRREVAAMLA